MPTAPSSLLETARVLWATGDAEDQVRITRHPRPPAGTCDWMVLPRPGAPRWLLPAGAPRTAVALLGQEASVRRRAAVRALAAAHRWGLARRLPVRRLRVPVPGADEGSLLAAVLTVTGPGTDVAVRLGSWGHARSLVLRVFDAAGGTLAFGKVGIDPAGRESVRTETAALGRVAGLGLTRAQVPEVLHRETWRDLEVLLVSPLLPPPGRADDELPVAAMLELARSGGARTAALVDSAWWSRTQRRTAEVSEARIADELRAHLAALARASAGSPVDLGPGHGDWTPWNMARDGSRVLLWDWEHFTEDVPVGVDLVHHLAQRLRVREGTAPDNELRWAREAHEALSRHLGLDRHRRDLVLACYLLEVNLRFVLDRQGTPQAAENRSGWGPDLLRRHVEALTTPPR